MESPPSSVHGQATPSPKKLRSSAIEALLSPQKDPGVSPAAPEGEGVRGVDPQGNAASVLPGVLKVIAVEQQQQQPDGESSEGGRLDDVPLAGGGVRGTERSQAAVVREKGRPEGDFALTVRTHRGKRAGGGVG